jgi:hypothetical protein
MCSFGKPLKGPDGTKFYTGNKNDSAWNRDLLWKVFVVSEANVHSRRPDTSAGKIGLRRTMMGVTGTLVPETMTYMLNSSPEKVAERKEKTMNEASKFAPHVSKTPFSYGTPRESQRGELVETSARSNTARSGRTSRSSARPSPGRSSRTADEMRDLRRALDSEREKRIRTEDKLNSIEKKMDMLLSQMGKN